MGRLLAMVALVFVGMTLGPRAVRADAIDGPPACPPGAVGRSSHSGQWCEAAPCTTDADCGEDGGRCRAWRVCTRRASIPVGGLGQFRDPPPPPNEIDLVVGSCEPARACRGDEEPPPPTPGTFVEASPTCREATFCVPDALPGLPLIGAPSPSPVPPPSSAAQVSVEREVHASCNCAVPREGSAMGTPWGGLALAALALALRRRR